MKDAAVFIPGDHVFLRALSEADCNQDYLRWLNDPDVLRYRGPKAFPQTLDDLRSFLVRAKDSQDLHLAICIAETNKHIGNVALNSINWIHSSAELSIMIGERECWGKGYAKETISLVTRHAFLNMGLNRLWSESPNPAFNTAVASLGWIREGVKRQAFLLDGGHVDMECYSILRDEFVPKGRPRR